GTLLEELPDRRDDPSGVTADLRHVGEPYVVDITGELVAQQAQVRFRDGDERGLPLGETLRDEGCQAGDVAVGGVVQQGVVAQPEAPVRLFMGPHRSISLALDRSRLEAP